MEPFQTPFPAQYVVDLSEGDGPDTIRFQLSYHVGARYGAPPSSVLYLGTTHRARLSVTVDVEMTAPISEVISRTHTIQLIPVTPGSVPVDRLARVQFTSQDTFLDNDFLLEVQAPGLDTPRCFSEPCSDRDNTM